MILGIDPGLTGAVAAWYLPGAGRVADTPVIGAHYDIAGMAQLLREMRALAAQDAPCTAVIERQQAHPGQGLVSTGTLMLGYGIWLGVLGALGIATILVTPAVWKRHMGLSGKTKDDARALAKRLHPEAVLHLKKHHGRAEALLIADYGAERYSR